MSQALFDIPLKRIDGTPALEIFAQGLTMGLRLGDTGRSLTTDMTGTAAARSAIRSQCGF